MKSWYWSLVGYQWDITCLSPSNLPHKMFGHHSCSNRVYTVFHPPCLLVSHADDSTLLIIIPAKDFRLSATAEINADICSYCRIADWGKDALHVGSKSNTICVSLKHDVEKYVSLFMHLLEI